MSRSDDHLDEVLAVLGDRQGTTVQQFWDGRSSDATDEQALEADAESSLYRNALEQTEDFLLKRWQRTGADFEYVVAAVLEALGYTSRVTQATGDQGVDIIAHPDRLGLERPYLKVQVKSTAGSVGGPIVSQLRGTLHPGEKGMVVSLGTFTREALNAARATPDLVLVDGAEFVRLFLDVYDDLDASWQARFPLKRVFVPEV